MKRSLIKKRGFGNKHISKKRKKYVNAGIKMVNDNMVYMKQLHRGPKKNYQLFGQYGNPSGLIFKNSPSGYSLRGSPVKTYSNTPAKTYSKSKKIKFRKNYLRSEL